MSASDMDYVRTGRRTEKSARAQKFELFCRSFDDAFELYGSQSPVLVAIAREQDILWAGMTKEERAQVMR